MTVDRRTPRPAFAAGRADPRPCRWRPAVGCVAITAVAAACGCSDLDGLSTERSARLAAPIPAASVAAAVRHLPEAAEVVVGDPDPIGSRWFAPVYGPGHVTFTARLPGPVWWRTTVRQRPAGGPFDHHDELDVRLDWSGDGGQPTFTPDDRRRLEAEADRIVAAVVRAGTGR